MYSVLRKYLSHVAKEPIDLDFPLYERCRISHYFYFRNARTPIWKWIPSCIRDDHSVLSRSRGHNQCRKKGYQSYAPAVHGDA